jgi:hypothetical protein
MPDRIRIMRRGEQVLDLHAQSVTRIADFERRAT